jgi:Crp-like helix-turn-helix domain
MAPLLYVMEDGASAAIAVVGLDGIVGISRFMAVCNRHHTLDQQLCRWLLLSLDRLRSSELVMTQELIANMLGVRREGVTAAAGRLHRAGLIDYLRGHITVLDRLELERRTCECYASGNTGELNEAESVELLDSIRAGLGPCLFLCERLCQGDGFVRAIRAQVADRVALQVDGIRDYAEQGRLGLGEQQRVARVRVGLHFAVRAYLGHAPRDQARLDGFAAVLRQNEHHPGRHVTDDRILQDDHDVFTRRLLGRQSRTHQQKLAAPDSNQYLGGLERGERSVGELRANFRPGGQRV